MTASLPAAKTARASETTRCLRLQGCRAVFISGLGWMRKRKEMLKTTSVRLRHYSVDNGLVQVHLPHPLPSVELGPG